MLRCVRNEGLRLNDAQIDRYQVHINGGYQSDGITEDNDAPGMK